MGRWGVPTGPIYDSAGGPIMNRVRTKWERWTDEMAGELLALYENGTSHDALAERYDLRDAKSVRGTVCKLRARLA